MALGSARAGAPLYKEFGRVEMMKDITRRYSQISSELRWVAPIVLKETWFNANLTTKKRCLNTNC